MATRKRKGRRHTARERHVYRVLKRKYPSYTKSHVWAMVMGMSPRTLHKAKFKTKSRQVSVTHLRAAAARGSKTAAAKLRALGYSTSSIRSRVRRASSSASRTTRRTVRRSTARRSSPRRSTTRRTPRRATTRTRRRR